MILTEQQIVTMEIDCRSTWMHRERVLPLIASHREQAKMIETLKAERLTLAQAFSPNHQEPIGNAWAVISLADRVIAEGESNGVH